MDPEKITLSSFAGVLLALVVWMMRFILTRLETAIRENTHALKNVMTAIQGVGPVPPYPPPEPGKKAY